MRSMWILGASNVAACCFAVMAGAQEAAPGPYAVGPQPVTRVASESSQAHAQVGMQRVVDLEFDALPLADAIDVLADRAGIRVVYRRTVFGNRRVTIPKTRLAAQDAFARVLAGTGLAIRATVDANGVYAIGPADMRTSRTGVVAGKIVHAKTKTPVSGATVTIQGVEQHVNTRDDGTFRLEGPPGEHTVSIRALGYVPQIRKVTIPADGTITIDIVLEPSASVLNEVVVTGTIVATARKAIPNPITVITAEEIERRGVTRIEELLRGSVPGVFAAEQGTAVYRSEQAYAQDNLGGTVTAQVYSRGSSGSGRYGVPTPLKTFVDGVELLDPAYLGTLDPRSIERIEVVAGPQAATIYGAGAMGGVMQIFTKKGNSVAPEVTATLRYGMLQSNISGSRAPTHNDIVSLNGGAGPAFTYAANGSHDYSGQWQPALYSRRFGLSLGSTLQLHTVTVSGSLATTTTSNGTTGSLRTNLYYETPTTARLRETGVYESVNMAGYNSRRLSKTSNQTFALNLDYRPLPFWQHHATVGRSQNTFKVVPEAPVWSVPADTLFRTSESNGRRINWSYNTTLSAPLASRLSSVFTLGMSGSGGEQTRFTACVPAASSTRYQGCAISQLTEILLQKSIDDRSVGAFGNWRVGVFDQLYVTLGLRGERSPNYGEAHSIDWTPTNGLAYTMEYRDLTVKVLGSYGRATRTPPASARRDSLAFCNVCIPYAYVANKNNPEIRPEYSRGPQAGVELYWGNVGGITVNHYQQTVTDLLQLLLVDSVPYIYTEDGKTYYQYQTQWHNTAKIRQFGWETTGALTLGPLAFKGTYSWNDSRVLSLPPKRALLDLVHEGMSFSGIPSHLGSVSVAYASGPLSVNLNTSIVGKALITGISQHGDESWDQNIRWTRLKMYNSIGVRRGGNYTFSKPGYVKTDLVFMQRLSGWASATVNIVNVGNNFGSEGDAGNPSLGRQTTVGITLRHRLGQ